MPATRTATTLAALDADNLVHQQTSILVEIDDAGMKEVLDCAHFPISPGFRRTRALIRISGNAQQLYASYEDVEISYGVTPQ